MNCVSYIESDADMADCFDKLVDDAESYIEEYPE
jgi:hypothetical protein